MRTKGLLDGLLLVNAVRTVAFELHTHPRKFADVNKVLDRLQRKAHEEVVDRCDTRSSRQQVVDVDANNDQVTVVALVIQTLA